MTKRDIKKAREQITRACNDICNSALLIQTLTNCEDWCEALNELDDKHFNAIVQINRSAFENFVNAQSNQWREFIQLRFSEIARYQLKETITILNAISQEKIILKAIYNKRADITQLCHPDCDISCLESCLLHDILQAHEFQWNGRVVTCKGEITPEERDTLERVFRGEFEYGYQE